MEGSAGGMNVIISCFFFILAVLPSTYNAEKCTTGFSVVAPESAVPGKTIAVLINLHQDPSESKRLANVSLRLQTERITNPQDTIVICHTSKLIHGHGIISLKVPLTEPGLHILHTIVNFPQSEEKPRPVNHTLTGLDQDCEYQSRSYLTIVGPVRDVIIRPDKQIYSPGESVTFWVLALDHDLKLPKGVLGTVALQDPTGTKVAVWEQVSLDDGVKKFDIALSTRATLGTWMLHVVCGDSTWNRALNVSNQGSTSGYRDSEMFSGVSGGRSPPAAEEHSVELRFAPNTKRWYKPGLSYKGKVEAVSTEKYIQVKVEIFDDTTSIYSQGVEIPQSDGSFTVPYMVSNSDVLNLQAELVSVEGKEIESHYILARESLQKWNSSSKCYLVIEGLDSPLQVGSRAQVKVVSTCSCERELHVAVVTDGRLTLWAERSTSNQGSTHTSTRASDGTVTWGSVQPEPGIVGTMHCSLRFSFVVKSDMAPSSQILVYYISSDGEPVSDVSDFEVQLLHKDVSVSLDEQKSWQIGDKVQVDIKAETGSLICLIGGSATSEKFDPFESQSHSRSSIQSEQDFLEAGLTLFQRRCPVDKSMGKFKNGSGSGRGARSSVTYRPGGIRSHRRPPLLPQPTDRIWMWDCFTYSSDTAKRHVALPNEEGVYSVWAASVGPSGLKIAAAHQIPIQPPSLRVSLQQPPPLTVRETLELDVSISNNLDACMDVTALLSLSGGGRFLSNNMLYVTEKLRLGPRGATSLVVKVVVTSSGIHNLTAEISGVAGGCVTRESKIGPQGGTILRTVTLKVRSEGLTRTDTESAYFCANEHTLISTDDKYGYEWISAPRNREVLVFEVRAGSSIRIALSDERGPTDDMYHVNIGDSGNSLVWIGRGQHGYGVHLSAGEINDALSAGGFRTFWVSWARGTLTAGRGAQPPTGSLAVWKIDSTHHVRHVGFSSPWGHQADFRVWNFNDEAGFSQVVQLSLPRWAVPGTAAGELLVAGGLAIPENQIDYKLGYQNDDDTKMSPTSSLATATSVFSTLFVLHHANSTQHEAIIKKLPQQVQRLLSFRMKDNSFSDHPTMQSHLSTVQVLEVLYKVQSYFGVDPELLESMKRWIQHRQEDDGSFTPLPADIKISMLTTDADMENNAKKSPLNIYEELDYGIVEKWKNLSRAALELERKIEVTAETLATLIEIGMENEEDLNTVTKAKLFLEQHIHNVTSSHPLASMTYALALTQSALLPDALKILKNASTTEEGDFGWPHPLPRRDADWLYEEDSTRRLNPPVLTSLEDFKASLCVLSIYTVLGDLQSAEPVARYLFYRSHLLDKHTELLYQAVKSFSAFSTLAYDRHRSLTVSLATAGMELTDTVELKADYPARYLHLPSLPTKVFVYATGAGCATVQGRITYSAYTPSSENALLTLWSAVIEEIRPERSSLEELQGKLPALNIKTCFRWKGQERSGPLRLEVSLFSGYEMVSVNPVVMDEGAFADLQHGSKDNLVWFSFANISSTCPVCVTYQARSSFILSSLRPAFATVYPASRPDLAAELFFHTKQGSPLLKGIIEDDLITWFGKTDSGFPNVGQDLPNICECGKICRNGSINSTKEDIINAAVTTVSSVDTKDEQKIYSVVNDTEKIKNITYNVNDTSKNINNDIPIIIPSVIIVNKIEDAIKSTVSANHSNEEDEIVVQRNISPVPKLNTAKILYDLARKQPYSKKPYLTRKKGTLKHTYGENHEMLRKNVKIVHINVSNLTHVVNNIKNVTDTDYTTVIPNSTILNNHSYLQTTNIVSPVTTMLTTEPYINTKTPINSEELDTNKTTIKSYTNIDHVTERTNILKDSTTTEAQNKFTTQSTITTSTLSNIKKKIAKISISKIKPTKDTMKHYISQIPKSINHEKQHPPSPPISETTLEMISKTPPINILPKKDQFVVVNKNELWSMLKEVVKIEMDKNQEKSQAESQKNDSNDIKNTSRQI